MRPRRPVAARLALLPVVAALALALAAPAHAAGERHQDAVRDQVSNGGPAPQPVGDITAISTQHTRQAVVVTTRFRRIDPSYLYFATRISTPEAEYAAVYDTYLSAAEGEFELRDEMGDMLWCPGFTGRINEDAGLIRVSVPRDCLDRPMVVRTGALSSPIRRGGPDGRIIPPSATDDARLRGRLAGDPAGSVITLGPKVRVG